jgi:hypothetical protein
LIFAHNLSTFERDFECLCLFYWHIRKVNSQYCMNKKNIIEIRAKVVCTARFQMNFGLRCNVSRLIRET